MKNNVKKILIGFIAVVVLVTVQVTGKGDPTDPMVTITIPFNR